MTERTIRHLAKQLAGEYYGDSVRSDRFRVENPSELVYSNKMWPHFVQLARQRMVAMLRMPGVSKTIKDGIMKALIEENAKATDDGAALIPQAFMEPVEKEDQKLIADNPQLISSDSLH